LLIAAKGAILGRLMRELNVMIASLSTSAAIRRDAA
jgi:hypothetical protein